MYQNRLHRKNKFKRLSAGMLQKISPEQRKLSNAQRIFIGGKILHDSGRDLHDGEKVLHESAEQLHDGGIELHDGGRYLLDSGKELHDGEKVLHESAEVLHDDAKEIHDRKKIFHTKSIQNHFAAAKSVAKIQHSPKGGDRRNTGVSTELFRSLSYFCPTKSPYDESHPLLPCV